jgi:hypothetical protein
MISFALDPSVTSSLRLRVCDMISFFIYVVGAIAISNGDRTRDKRSMLYSSGNARGREFTVSGMDHLLCHRRYDEGCDLS